MQRKKDILKERWLILGTICLAALCAGSQYAWSVFASPVAEYLTRITGRETGSLAIVFTVADSVGPVTMRLGGQVNDRLGPRLVLFSGRAQKRQEG